MLLSITTTHRPATDLGFLLHKHPDRFQSFSLSFGQAHVFYPEATSQRCTACLLLDVNPIDMVRGRGQGDHFLLEQYVNDRPYVASSFMSVAMTRVFRTAMSGICRDRPELARTALPLEVSIEVLPSRGDEDLIPRVFEPLGYEVEATRHALDAAFSHWGDSPYYSVALRTRQTLAQVLNHLYVLIPVFDNSKHYFVGEDELRKLLAKGDGWLVSHPEKSLITRRYLKHQASLYRQALARLVERKDGESVEDSNMDDRKEQALERPLSLNEQRHGAVLAALRAARAPSVVDLGCGEGKLLRELVRDRQFERIVGMDVSIRSLERARKRLRLDQDRAGPTGRVTLLHGSLIYRDKRLKGFDAAAVVEVIEHLDPPRLAALERTLFEFAQPRTVVITTPNREYNVMWESLPAGSFRHRDHRFEWTRAEFRQWTSAIATRFGYSVRHLPVGPENPTVGAPTQMAVFTRA